MNTTSIRWDRTAKAAAAAAPATARRSSTIDPAPIDDPRGAVAAVAPIETWRELGAAGWGLILAAPVIGSFLGVLIRRLPEGRPIVWARPRREHCRAGPRPPALGPLVRLALAPGRR